MRALVTGANGFIGAWLVRTLLEDGASVTGMVREQSDRSSLEGLAVDLVVADVTAPETLGRALADVQVVFHLAGALAAPDGAAFDRVNVLGTRHLVEAVRRERPRLERFVLVSSIAAGGPGRAGTRRREEDPPVPGNAYGRSKLGGEEVLRALACEMPFTIVRPPIVYGPGGRNIAALFRCVQRRIIVEIAGPPRLASFLHVRDLARGLVLAARRTEGVDELFHLVHPREGSIGDFQRAIARELGLRALSVSLPPASLRGVAEAAELWKRVSRRSFPFGRDRITEALAPSWVMDGEKARRRLGYEATIDWPEGIRDSIADQRARGWLR